MSGDVRASAVAHHRKLSEEMLSSPAPEYQGHPCVFPSSAPVAAALLNDAACMLLLPLSGLGLAAQLACTEPGFDAVPWRLRCVVLMGC